MATWKKIITSGSNADLNQITSSGGIKGTLDTAAQTNITSVGALDGGSITSGFGNIDVGSSTITTTGAISGGSATLTGALNAKGGAVFNEDAADVDFRVESSNDPNLLVVDGGSDFVSIGESSQVNGCKLSIATSAGSSILSLLTRSTTDSDEPFIVLQKSSTASLTSACPR